MRYAAVLFCCALLTGTAEEDPFTLALMLRDSMLPIASYDGSSWHAPWPSRIEEGSPKITQLADVPHDWLAPAQEMPRTWVVYDSLGTHPVQLEHPVVLVDEYNWGLSRYGFLYQSEAAAAPNSGLRLATNHAVNLQVFTYVAEDDPIRLLLSERVRAVLEKQESAYYERFSRDREWLGAAEQTVNAPGLLQARLAGEETLVFFVITKAYRLPPELQPAGRCDLYSHLQGWIRVEADQTLTLLETDYASTNCEWKVVTSRSPLGLLQQGEHFSIFTIQREWEGEAFTIDTWQGDHFENVLEANIYGL